jgi:hypothetical protein
MTWKYNIYSRIKFVTERFEQLIDAQGQTCKWEQAIKCTCYDDQMSTPDYKCTFCDGRGYVYKKPKEIVIHDVVATILTNKKIHVGCGDRISSIKRVHMVNPAIEFSVRSLYGNEVTLEEDYLQENMILLVDYVKSLEHTVTENVHTTTGTLNELIMHYPIIDTIISIRRLDTHVIVPVLYFTDNKIRLSMDIPINVQLNVIYTYVDPIKIIVQDAKEKRSFKPIGEILEGDAILTFSPYYYISDRDRITILNEGVNTRYNELLIKGTNDKLHLDFIEKILDVRDTTREYFEGEDFVLDGTREIKWLSTGYAPALNAQYSVSYLAKHEYIIWGDSWQDRKHGDVYVPRRVQARKLDKVNFLKDASFENDI